MPYTHSDSCRFPRQRLNAGHASHKREEGGEFKQISQNSTSKGPVLQRTWAQSFLSALGCPAVHAAGPGACEWGQLQECSLYFTVYNTLTWRWPTLTSQLCQAPARRVDMWEALCQPLCAQLRRTRGRQTPKNPFKDLHGNIFGATLSWSPLV